MWATMMILQWFVILTKSAFEIKNNRYQLFSVPYPAFLNLNDLHNAKANTHLFFCPEGVASSAVIASEKLTNNFISIKVGKILSLSHLGCCTFYFGLHMRSKKNKLHSLQLNNWKVLTPKGTLNLKNISTQICFCCICDFSFKYCHQSNDELPEMAEASAKRWANKVKATTSPQDLGSAKEFRL